MELLQPGEVVNERYRIDGMVGSGGFGAVYRAFDTSQNRYVALKHMLENPDQNPDPYLAERFEAECSMLETLHHTSIPKFFDHFRLPTGRFLVMEFVEGLTLEDWIDERKHHGETADAAQVLRFVLQVCEVLEYLHGQPEPVLHRDIKPQNLILRPDGRTVMLVDFGLARSLDTSQTRTHVGTVGYAALEQVRGRPEPCSDIYSLGATMFHLLTLERPTPFAIAPIESVRPDLPPRLAYLVNMACDQTPARRFMSATKMRLVIEEVLHEMVVVGPQPKLSAPVDLPPMPEPVLDEQPHPARSSRSWIGVGAVLTAAVLWFFHPGSGSHLAASTPGDAVSHARAVFSVMGFKMDAPLPPLEKALTSVLTEETRSSWSIIGSSGVGEDATLRANADECAGLLIGHHHHEPIDLPVSLSFQLLGGDKDAHLTVFFGGNEAHFKWQAAQHEWGGSLQRAGRDTTQSMDSVAAADGWSPRYVLGFTNDRVQLTEPGKVVYIDGACQGDSGVRFVLFPTDHYQTVKIQDVSIQGAE